MAAYLLALVAAVLPSNALQQDLLQEGCRNSHEGAD